MVYDKLYATTLRKGQKARGHIQEITKCVENQRVSSHAIEENINP